MKYRKNTLLKVMRNKYNINNYNMDYNPLIKFIISWLFVNKHSYAD